MSGIDKVQFMQLQEKYDDLGKAHVKVLEELEKLKEERQMCEQQKIDMRKDYHALLVEDLKMKECCKIRQVDNQQLQSELAKKDAVIAEACELLKDIGGNTLIGDDSDYPEYNLRIDKFLQQHKAKGEDVGV